MRHIETARALIPPRPALVFVLVCAASGVARAETIAVPVIETKGDPAAGFVTVSWKLPVDQRQPATAVFEVQIAGGTGAWRALYTGKQTASFVSGLDDGNHRFRARVVNAGRGASVWSPPTVVAIKHHSLSLALTLCALGALVFAATTFTLIRGRREQDG